MLRRVSRHASRNELDLSDRRFRDGSVLGFFHAEPSFLDFQRRLENDHARSNCQTLFDIPQIPADNRVRDMLDPAEPDLLYPVFAEAVAILKA
jgi:hypothetical protein